LGHLIRNALGILALWFVTIIPTGVHPQLSPQQQRQLQQYQQMQVGSPDSQGPWVTSYWDLGQNIKLDQLNGHINATDVNVENLRNKHEALAREVSESHGEQTVWFSIISACLLGIGGLAISNMMRLRSKQ
jgi:phosphotransferase system  glucose/maltose/N-acetylglucosamine-specific IIC component